MDYDMRRIHADSVAITTPERVPFINKATLANSLCAVPALRQAEDMTGRDAAGRMRHAQRCVWQEISWWMEVAFVTKAGG